MGRLRHELSHRQHLLGRPTDAIEPHRRGARDPTWIHLGFLFAITLMPLSTRLLAGFITYRVALGVYWLNILVPGVVLFWSWPYAVRHDLVKAGMPDTECRSICPRGS
jgi:hypothetical protein